MLNNRLKTIFRFILLCVLGSVWGQAQAEAAPEHTLKPTELPAFEARYQLSSLGLPFAQAERSLKKTGANEYLFYTHAQTIGVMSWVREDEITESSRWRFADGALQPLHYYYLQTGGKRERRREIRFDWDKGVAHSRKNDEHWELTLQPGTLDMLLSQLALMWELLQDPRTGARSYQIAHNDEIKSYRIDFNGEEVLDTAMGKVRTVKFTRRDPKNPQRFSVLWCAPELHYLAARIEHTEPGGDTVRAQIETVRFTPSPVTGAP